jgi:hypothetical protein
MSDHISASADELMRQADWTADKWFNTAIKIIDDEFGKGYATIGEAQWGSFQLIKEQKEKERLEKIARLEAETVAKFDELENNYITSTDSITADMFCQLCDKYNVEIPARTKGFILKNVSEITRTKGFYITSNNNKATVNVFRYIDRLNKKLDNKE